MELLKFGRVNVHSDLVCLAGEILGRIPCNGKVQPYAYGEKKIRVLQGEVGPAAATDPGRPT